MEIKLKSLLRRKLLILFFIGLVFASCTSVLQPTSGIDTTPEPSASATALPTQTATSTPVPLSVWVNPDLPLTFRANLPELSAFQVTMDPNQADLQITWLDTGEEWENSAQWIYALVAPFPTLIDEVSSEAIRATWMGATVEPFNGSPILLSAESAAVFGSLWGEPAEHAVQIIPAEELVDTAWAERPGWAILPFEELSSRWKVIQVDGLSPLDPQLEVSQYPLKISIGWISRQGTTIPQEVDSLEFTGNRNAEHIARVFMTGTTAMVRNMALRMEEEGVLYPAEKIGQLLQSADLTHISNEVSFYSECPAAKPLRASLRFCTSTRYLQTLEAVGADVIELTGNHLLDWGTDAFSETLKLYETAGLAVYGGGWNQEDARQPYKVEINGNKLAFIGCNPSGPDADWATEDSPGSAQCDYDWMEAQIRALRSEGYLPIVTIQHIEVYDYKPTSAQRVISEQMAEAGAALISGSQSHFPQGFAFVGDTLIHYGLGNTFFDQMDNGPRRGFLDRSVFYEGRLISTEVFTIILEDYAQPRLMTPEERQAMLEIVFKESGWLDE
jgi:poly-gamma-glutamate synthesis protein (capsule biosynthesis protein)